MQPLQQQPPTGRNITIGEFARRHNFSSHAWEWGVGGRWASGSQGDLRYFFHYPYDFEPAAYFEYDLAIIIGLGPVGSTRNWSYISLVQDGKYVGTQELNVTFINVGGRDGTFYLPPETVRELEAFINSVK